MSAVRDIKRKYLRRYAQRDIVTIIISLFAIIGMIIVSIKILIPKIAEVRIKLNEIDDIRQQAEVLSEKAEILSSLQQESLTEDLKTSERAFPPEIDPIILIDTIEGISEVSGTEVGDISFKVGSVSTESAQTGQDQVNDGSKEDTDSSVTASDNDNVLKLSLKFSGSRPNIDSIFDYFDQAAPLLIISDIELDYTTSGLAELNLPLTVYFQPSLKVTVDPAQSLARLSTSQELTLNSLKKLKPFYPEPSGAVVIGGGESTVQRENLFTLPKGSIEVPSTLSPISSPSAEATSSASIEPTPSSVAESPDLEQIQESANSR